MHVCPHLIMSFLMSAIPRMLLRPFRLTVLRFQAPIGDVFAQVAFTDVLQALRVAFQRLLLRHNAVSCSPLSVMPLAPCPVLWGLQTALRRPCPAAVDSVILGISCSAALSVEFATRLCGGGPSLQNLLG